MLVLLGLGPVVLLLDVGLDEEVGEEGQEGGIDSYGQPVYPQVPNEWPIPIRGRPEIVEVDARHGRDAEIERVDRPRSEEEHDDEELDDLPRGEERLPPRVPLAVHRAPGVVVVHDNMNGAVQGATNYEDHLLACQHTPHKDYHDGVVEHVQNSQRFAPERG